MATQKLKHYAGIAAFVLISWVCMMLVIGGVLGLIAVLVVAVGWTYGAGGPLAVAGLVFGAFTLLMAALFTRNVYSEGIE